MREGRTWSPASLLDLAEGDRIVMPSPNGSALSHAALASGLTVIAGGMRNASAVAHWLARRVSSVGLVPAGEQWADHSLRVAYEDLVGAGAIADSLERVDPTAELSADARAAVAAFQRRRPLAEAPSGRELVDRGFADDVALAEDVDADPVVPVLRDGRYIAAAD
jgi:2-phosphosulfolactate phosphatase